MLAWMFAAIAVYCVSRVIVLDDRLSGKRRGGKARWALWIPPHRWRDVSHTQAGAPTGRAPSRLIGLAVLLGLIALALSSL